MKKIDTALWWASLTVRQKERIASKVASKRAGKPVEVLYPNCTNLWNDLREEEKLMIYRHCTDEHGVLMKEWSEGKMMSE